LCSAGLRGFAALFTVFAFTWLATRIGYARKQRLGTAEARAGRNALQVLANLGTAAVCALLYIHFPNPAIFVAMAAALAEATTDTVSSEIGQAMGGTPRLITTWQKVGRGTNGAITGIGTAAGAVNISSNSPLTSYVENMSADPISRFDPAATHNSKVFAAGSKVKGLLG